VTHLLCWVSLHAMCLCYMCGVMLCNEFGVGVWSWSSHLSHILISLGSLKHSHLFDYFHFACFLLLLFVMGVISFAVDVDMTG